MAKLLSLGLAVLLMAAGSALLWGAMVLGPRVSELLNLPTHRSFTPIEAGLPLRGRWLGLVVGLLLGPMLLVLLVLGTVLIAFGVAVLVA